MMNDTASPFWFVTQYLTVKDMCVMESTCKYVKHDVDIWTYFYNYLKQRLYIYDASHLEHLYTIFYNNPRKAVKALHMRKLWEKYSLQDQLECLQNSKIIKMYLISLWARHGKGAVQMIRNYLNQNRCKGRMRWMVPTWDMLEGKSTHFFRRNYLPVY
jgi:hypothetical protein